MNQNPSFEICVLGSANSDHFLEIDDFPKEGETIGAKNSYIKNGGKGANQAVASALLGSKTIFAGQIGKDELGQILVKEMNNSGCNLGGLREVEEQTGQAIILLNNKGQNSIIIVGGANQHYQQLEQLPEEYVKSIGNANFLQLQMEIPQKINALAARNMKQQNKFTMLDCGGRAEKLNHDFLRDLSFVSPNETELERIIGEEIDLQDDINILEKTVHDKILARFPELIVLVKLGSSGSFLVAKEYSVRCQTVSQMNPKVLEEYKIVDTVGAGDCFTSAFCTYFYEQLSKHGEVRTQTLNALSIEERKDMFQKSMHFASASAFLCITKHGAMPSMPKKDVVIAFLNKYF